MAKLTAAARNKISGSNFALPGRRYPIEDASHARNALARVSQHGTSAEKAKVRAAVHRKYPGIGEKNKSNDRRNDTWGPIMMQEPHARMK
jgi:hypothetical protein